ncbi:helix-turn-helix transcriptional regulator [Oceanidesulfovibrio marinus]|uniref:Helix-turn-helix domain-containing protein n=1 Tax=Oceanidesulfovibrio marinus TaxID=370038 RepID=A0A6P1ZMM1_9BACT|nr:helix-turn-helix domain-containing protein [Oceanidesulfovibrio marinus]TVM35617.1 hypothetical protein DQK91_02835 [Oceanidesulfovibrio marinus]
MAENGKTIVGKKAICAYLDVSQRTFDRMVDQNTPAVERLPAYRFGESGAWRLDLSDYEAWKAKMKELV